MTAVADSPTTDATEPQTPPTDSTFTVQLATNIGKVAKVTLTGDDVPVEGKVGTADPKDGEVRFKIGRRTVSVSTITKLDFPEPVDPPATPAASASADNADAKAVAQAAKEVEKANKAAEKAAAKATKDAEKAAAKIAKDAAKAAAKAEKPEPVKVTLTSGKVATGKTLTIRCAWVDPDKRTKAQQKLFDTGFAGVEKGKSYEAMVKAAGTGAKKDESMPDGTERVIKIQDAFQVRFSPANQKKHRNELRRRKSIARKAERDAAKASADAAKAN